MVRFAPPLSYPLSRELSSSWLGPALYGFAGLSFCILIVVNVALTGYRVVPTTTHDYFATKNHWFHKIAPQKAGDLCDPDPFIIGETISTNHSLFKYTLLGLDASRTAFEYKGQDLSTCDIMSGSVSVDVTAGDFVDVILYVGCRSPELPFVAKVEYSDSVMNYAASRIDTDNVNAWFDPGVDYKKYEFGGNLDVRNLVQSTLYQAVLWVWAHFDTADNSWPAKFSVATRPSCAPTAFRGDPACVQDNSAPLTWNYDWQTGWLLYANGTDFASGNTTITPLRGTNWNGTTSDYDTPTRSYSNEYFPAVTDLMQIFASAVRLDFGMFRPNNLFLDPAMVNVSITNPDLQSYVYAKVQNASTIPTFFDTFTNGPPTQLRAHYVCKFLEIYDPGRAFINITVATFSLFMTGWGIAMFAIGFFAKRKPEGRYCEGHSVISESQPPTPSAARLSYGREKGLNV